VSPDSAAAHSWETTVGGGMHTAGVGGEFTGRGFDLMVVDDPIKNAEQANSEVYRQKLIDWYQTTFYTRLEPNGSIIATMARWHEEDLFGYLIDEMKAGGEKWEIINLPAIAEGNDPMGRKPGEALWPRRRPRVELVGEDGEGGIKRAVGSRTWASLYQQRPAPDDGGFFKRSSFRYYRRGKTSQGDGFYILSDPKTGTTRKVLDRDCWTLITADTAMTERTTSDYWVLGVWHLERLFDTGEDGKAYQRGVTAILRDVWRAQCGAPEGEARLLEYYERYKPDFFGVEDKVSGTAIIQRFQRDGLPVRGIKADTDKITRASTSQLWYEQGKVWLPLDAPWLSDYEAEHLVFPNGKHDDQVDMTAHAINFANNRDLWITPPPETYKPNTLGAIAGHGELED
jgi:predicted phage terminase large subunit-like protein